MQTLQGLEGNWHVDLMITWSRSGIQLQENACRLYKAKFIIFPASPLAQMERD